MNAATLILAGFALDLLIGDPAHWPHPIRAIGSLIAVLERTVRRICYTPRDLQCGGLLLWLAVVSLTYGISWGLIWGCMQLSWIGLVLHVLLISSVLATKGLKDAAMPVYRALKSGDLQQSRIALSYIVGRDTRQLQPEQIRRGTVETVAENTVDGVIAPLFYLCLGGFPLAMTYKAINTMDSMLGYQNEKYRWIGYAPAKLDDVANWIPARISWPLFALAAWFLRLNAKQALRLGWRDRHQHKSPNCAWAEASVAGALGVQLNGPNDYFGERIEKPWVGDPVRAIETEDIPRAIRLMYTTAALAALFLCGFRVVLS